MNQSRLVQYYSGISGWFRVGRYKMERLLFTLHRMTGLVLLLIFLAYLTRITIVQFQGGNIWIFTLLFIHNRWFGLVAALFSFHALNGLRLSLHELGFMLGKPAPPVYPYGDAMRSHRSLTIVSTIASALLALIFIYVFFIAGVWR